MYLFDYQIFAQMIIQKQSFSIYLNIQDVDYQYSKIANLNHIISIQVHLETMQRNLHANGMLDQTEFQYKDSMISSLKKELFELKDLEHDFLRLNDEVCNIQSKYALLLDEKERAENQNKIKIDVNKKAINDLRSQIDTLKMQIHKMSIQIEDTLRENTTLKRMCQNRQAQIHCLIGTNRELQKNIELQQEENRSLSVNLKQLKEQRTKNENECDRLNKLLDQSLGTLKQLEKQSRQLQSTNTKLQNVLLQAEKDHECLLEELKSREEIAAGTTKKIEILGQEEGQLKQKITKLDRQCQKSKSEYQELCQALQNCSNKNKDLTGKLKNLETSVRTSENELEQSTIKRQNLRKEHLQCANENRVLNSEIDKCLLSILQYERINKDLQKEIENYIECDEEARNMLNRKESMRGLLEQVATKLHKTQEQIAHLR